MTPDDDLPIAGRSDAASEPLAINKDTLSDLDVTAGDGGGVRGGGLSVVQTAYACVLRTGAAATCQGGGVVTTVSQPTETFCILSAQG